MLTRNNPAFTPTNFNRNIKHVQYCIKIRRSYEDLNLDGLLSLFLRAAILFYGKTEPEESIYLKKKKRKNSLSAFTSRLPLESL